MENRNLIIGDRLELENLDKNDENVFHNSEGVKYKIEEHPRTKNYGDISSIHKLGNNLVSAQRSITLGDDFMERVDLPCYRTLCHDWSKYWHTPIEYSNCDKLSYDWPQLTFLLKRNEYDGKVIEFESLCDIGTYEGITKVVYAFSMPTNKIMFDEELRNHLISEGVKCFLPEESSSDLFSRDNENSLDLFLYGDLTKDENNLDSLAEKIRNLELRLFPDYYEGLGYL